MNKLIGVIMCFVPFPIFAGELTEVPSLYLTNEFRQSMNDYPVDVENGYILIEKISQAQKYMRPIPPDVDFDKENLLLFVWGGSGQDKIDYDQDEEVYNFVLKRGLTRDYRLHLKLYVLKKTDNFIFHRVLH
jgi:hypothetical protein